MPKSRNRSKSALLVTGALLVAPTDAMAGIPDAKLGDSEHGTIWPGCLGGSASFSDTVKYHDGGLFQGGDEIEWWSSRSIGPIWNCHPKWPPWVWHHATITHKLKWTALQGIASVTITNEKPGVEVNFKNGILTATWTDKITNNEWVFGPKKSWPSEVKMTAIYDGAVRMRAEHRATVVFYGPDGVTMTLELEDHKEQWG